MLHGLVFTQDDESIVQQTACRGVRRYGDAVMHPLALAACGDQARAAQIGEMTGYLGLALAENFNEKADADFTALNEIEEAEACAIRKRGEEQCRVDRPGRELHKFIISALTHLCSENIFA